MKAIFFIVGALAGLLVVRGFMFDPIEEIAWRMFWGHLFDGGISADLMGKVVKSATFTKSMAGIGCGGLLGYFAATRLVAVTGAKETPSDSEHG